MTRIGTTDTGGSDFDEVDIELTDRGALGRMSDQWPVAGVIFRETEPTYDLDWHNAPQRQIIVLLDGAIEVEVTSGEKRQFTAGDILLVEDTTGTGHRTRSIGPSIRRSLFLPLPRDPEPDQA